MKKALLFACVVLLLASQATSRAGVIINIQQVGGDVVATASGSIDITDLTFIGNRNSAAFVWAGFPLGSVAVVGGTTTVSDDVYSGITGPSSFGSGDGIFATSGSGDVFGVVANNVLDLPSGYISGSALSATSTWSGESFSSLGLTPGSYAWTWGTGAHADSFTLNIGAAPVPEPSTLTMALFAGLAAIGARLWSRRGPVRA
jgi:PEP-CTERM motif